jgi:hypothetical protein
MRLRELDKTLPQHVRLLTARNSRSYDAKAPTAAIYFGGSNHATSDHVLLRRLISASAVVIPVVTKLSNFGRCVPKELLPINGLALRDHNFDTIANVVLENLSLLRKDRRLFISYRRSDSAAVALQLRHVLEANGYDAFLDTHSIRAGDPFQEILWQRMSDSDLVILIDSPNFLESRWTKEELAKAEALTIGLLQIVWPGHTPASHTDLCARLYLKTGDFNGAKLKDSVLTRVAASVEALRARCLAARHNNLVREFCDEVATIGAKAAVQPQRYVLATLKSKKKIAAIPAVGVPDAFRYYDANLRFPGKGKGADLAMLLYDHRGLRSKWSDFLSWLDRHLPVKAIRITDVAKELRRL